MSIDLVKSKEAISKLQDYYALAIKAPFGIFRKPFYIKETIEQMDYGGSGSFFIVFLVSLFIGMALSLQTSAELAEMGLKMYTGRVVGLSIIKEKGRGVVDHKGDRSCCDCPQFCREGRFGYGFRDWLNDSWTSG